MRAVTRFEDTQPLSALDPAGEPADEATMRVPRWRHALTSVRTRILLWYVVLLALALALSIFAVRQLLHVAAEQRIESALTQEVQELRRLARGIDPATSEPFGSRAARVFDVYRSRNVPFQHEVVLTFVNGRYYGASRPASFEQATLQHWARLTSSERGQVETKQGAVDYLAVPLKAGDRIAGVYVVAIFGDLERAEIREAVQILVAVASVTLLLASGLAWLAAGRVLAPIRLVTDTARAISESDLTRRIPEEGSGEVARLASTFNGMLDRLQAAFGSQRSFVDDAGHELRTPITIIRGHLELLGDDPEERRETIALVTDELDRMNRIVDDLLVLAKAQRPDFLHLETIDLDRLTSELHTKATALAPRAWRLNKRGKGVIVADRQRVTQAVVQLAQNATQHTVEGDEITLGTEIANGHAQLWVRDTGPGVAPEDHERIFDRFSRAAGTRRRSEGAGLGLSIVRAIAEAHGGTVELHSRPGQGATFTLTLPVDPPSDKPRERTP